MLVHLLLTDYLKPGFHLRWTLHLAIYCSSSLRIYPDSDTHMPCNDGKWMVMGALDFSRWSGHQQLMTNALKCNITSCHSQIPPKLDGVSIGSKSTMRPHRSFIDVCMFFWSKFQLDPGWIRIWRYLEPWKLQMPAIFDPVPPLRPRRSRNVWVTRFGDKMYEDLDDARALPGIKDVASSESSGGDYQRISFSRIIIDGYSGSL